MYFLRNINQTLWERKEGHKKLYPYSILSFKKVQWVMRGISLAIVHGYTIATLTVERTRALYIYIYMTLSIDGQRERSDLAICKTMISFKQKYNK